MDHVLHCSQGHQWGSTLALPEARCPVCGEAGIAQEPSLVPTLRLRPKSNGSPHPGLDQKTFAACADPLPVIPGYEVVCELGRGGMGVVYKARQLALGRSVALKMIRTGCLAGVDARARFRNEASAAARLQHPHIVQVHEIGEAFGTLFLCLEFVDGGTLSHALSGQPQPPEHAARLVEILASAVQAAHDTGVIHRDLKPSNVLLTGAGQPKIADFGLAKLTEQEGSHAPTRTGDVLGTPSYMAPEQARPDKHAIGPAVDIYALGAILYEMFTGRPPFAAPTSVETVLQVLGTEPIAPRRLQPAIPRPLEVITLKCLQKNPGQRYASAAELADDLARFRQNLPIRACPVSLAEKTYRWLRRNPQVAALTGVVVVLVAAAAYLGASWWLDQAALRAATSSRIAVLLDEASRKESLAHAAPLGDLSLWREALWLVDQGRQLDDFRDPERSALMDKQRRRLEAELAQAQRNATFAPLLEAIRTESDELDHDAFKRGQARARFLEAFSNHGLELLDADPVTLAEAIKRSPIRQELVEAVYTLASDARDAGERQRLLGICRLADAHADAAPLLAALVSRDRHTLLDWARKPSTLDLPAINLLVLGYTLKTLGEEVEAVTLWRLAQQRHPGDFWVNFNLGTNLFHLQPPRWDEAVGYLRVALAVRPSNPGVMNNLGIALQNAGYAGEAREVLLRAVQLKPDYAHFRLNLAVAQASAGDVDAAVASLHKALALNKHYPLAHETLARLHHQSGRFELALTAIEEAMALVPPGSERRALLEKQRATTAEFARRARLLALVLDGKHRPASGPEAMSFADLCFFQGRFADAARLAREALEHWPELADDRRGDWFRYNAACYAAKAGCDTSAPLNDAQRAAWRRQALLWLRADLQAWQAELRRADELQRQHIRQALLEWKADAALAGLRDPAALERLPTSEQLECRMLWSDVEALLKSTRQPGAVP